GIGIEAAGVDVEGQDVMRDVTGGQGCVDVLAALVVHHLGLWVGGVDSGGGSPVHRSEDGGVVGQGVPPEAEGRWVVPDLPVGDAVAVGPVLGAGQHTTRLVLVDHGRGKLGEPVHAVIGVCAGVSLAAAHDRQ